MNDDYPVQIILMRSDLDSLNPGKAMAQAAHASSVIHEATMNVEMDHDVRGPWKEQTNQGFGVCLVLDGVNEPTIQEIVEEIRTTHSDVFAEVIHDPTYPVTDGHVTHHIPVNTCAVILGMKSKTDMIAGLRDLELHP